MDKINIFKNELLIFHEKYPLLTIKGYFDEKINFWFAELYNECHYNNEMSYYDDVYILNNNLFDKMNTFDVVVADPSNITKKCKLIFEIK